MRKYTISLVTFCMFFILATNLIAQGDFEGKIKFKISNDGEQMFLDYFIKDSNLRMEMGDDAKAIFIKTEEKSYILMPEEKMYMDLDNSLFSKIQDMVGMEEEEDGDEDIEAVDMENFKTGKTKDILGYECHQWIFTSDEDDEEVEAWVTSELGNFVLMQSPMGAGYSPGWSTSINDNGFFPMLVITHDEDGKENSRFEATEVKKESLSNNLFTFPSDYSEMKIPGMKGLFK